jgi:hypothetical protein
MNGSAEECSSPRHPCRTHALLPPNRSSDRRVIVTRGAGSSATKELFGAGVSGPVLLCPLPYQAVGFLLERADRLADQLAAVVVVGGPSPR